MGKKALIIGNSNYSSYELVNPKNDAKDIKNIFEKMGIRTTLCEDLDKASFLQTIMDFSSEISEEHSEAIIFFYAGHGIQIENKLYLCPIDFNFYNVRDTAIGRKDRKYQAQIQSIELDTVIDEINSSGAETKVFILDACRNNPIDSDRGPEASCAVNVLAPKGTLIEFSTSPGQVASDYAYEGSSNSAFTHALLSFISVPGLMIEEVFKKTRVLLNQKTGGKQVSWEHSSLIGDLILFDNDILGKYSIGYSQISKSDEFYKPEGDQSIINIIESLKSHDWYKQNPVILELVQVCLSQKEISINDLFIIGRNIYQAACGDANECSTFIENLSANLQQIGEQYAFHIFNGILYEIFFNGKGILRPPMNYKVGKNQRKVLYQYPISLIEEVNYNLNKIFIQRQLVNYQSRIIYSSESVTANYEINFELFFVEKEDSEGELRPYIKEIKYKSYNILYSSGGTEHITMENDKFTDLFYKTIKEMLCRVIVCPNDKLHLICNEKKFKDNDIIYFPKDFQIRKTLSSTLNLSEDIRIWFYASLQ